MPTIHARCASCGRKWFFEEHHQARPDIDMSVCEGCGGELRPLTPDAQHAGDDDAER